ncbi:NPCBM/NEW2 domain-containing protein [Sphingomonas sp. LB-2]|uniref:NPCBM/NEW2 domain-containing protein n=1 Tax=Sphingomonas caeni TaxID=2984949 RepID=UPI00222F9586|nr:NPCBM/NEW2 domain-containing protein [Sphingomonas caeni]MCW3846033.1 NPCBM/NEW2 domain-containing protein [Sphingomonas caeni]
MSVRFACCIAALLATVSPLAAQAGPDPLAPTGRWSAYTRGAAARPPMGWNSWNAFGSGIDERKLLASAQVIVDTGLAAKGYRYIDLDDGWWLRRRTADGRIVIRTANFPSADIGGGETSFRPLTDRLHAMGLKAGIYSDIGRNSCAQMYSSDGLNQPEGNLAEREVGLYDNIDRDIGLYFRDWGFDLIKVDACGIRGLTPDSPWVSSGKMRALGPFIDSESLGRTDISTVRSLYGQVRQALEKYNPDNDFIYSLCLWGSADVRSWAKDTGNISRTSDDIAPTWGRMLHSLDSAARRPLYAHPGSWNDPDMLYIGTGDFDADHLTEARAHFALWAMLSAPLMIGYDLSKAPPALLDIFGNSRVIAVDQDPAGNQAVLAFDTDDLQIFVKTLANGDKAVAVVNRTGGPISGGFTADQLKLLKDADIALTDLWTGEQHSFRGEYKFKLAAHQTLIFTAHGTRRLAGGFYLSETPGIVNPAADGVLVPEEEPLVYRPIFWAGTHGSGEHPRYGGWGGAQPDQTPYGLNLGIGRQRFDTGIGILANSRLEVRNQGHARFSAQVGIDDSARMLSAPATFYVYGDGKLLARSPLMRFGQAPFALSADVRGVKLVELVVRTPTPGIQGRPVTWGEAALLD